MCTIVIYYYSDQQLSRSLYDQKYERRKSAALELEKLVWI